MNPRPSEQKVMRKRLFWDTVKRVLAFCIVATIVFVLACFINDYFSYPVTLSMDDGALYTAYQLPLDLSILTLFFFFLLFTGIILIVWFSWIKPQSVIYDRMEKEDLRRAIQARYRNKFWVTFALYSAFMVFLIVAFFVLKDSRIWYDYDPWYTTLVILRNIFPFAVMALWAGGAAVLLFRQWNRSASDIVGLVDSIEQMHTGTQGDTITVPQNLIELEPVLQEMFDTSCEDRQAVLETEKKKNDLVLYLAHDLKTPLTSVVGYLSLLSESEDLDQEKKDSYIEIAKDKALRLEGLIDQFFEISKFSFQEMELSKTAFSVNLLLFQLSDEFYPTLVAQGKRIDVTCESDIELVGDANLIARALNNIIRNAIAYSNAESTIEVQAKQIENRVQFLIMNEGKEIPQHQLDSIFDKFYRLDEARTTESGGAGLGLAIAKEIISRHGGSIHATSAQGKITFAITVPLK